MSCHISKNLLNTVELLLSDPLGGATISLDNGRAKITGLTRVGGLA